MVKMAGCVMMLLTGDLCKMRMIPTPSGQPIPYGRPKRKKLPAKPKKKKIVAKKVVQERVKTKKPMKAKKKTKSPQAKRPVKTKEKSQKVASKSVPEKQAKPSCIDDLIPTASKIADDILEAVVIKNGVEIDAAITWNRAYHFTMNSLCKKYGFR